MIGLVDADLCTATATAAIVVISAVACFAGRDTLLNASFLISTVVIEAAPAATVSISATCQKGTSRRNTGVAYATG